jgi:hypothetical protein
VYGVGQRDGADWDGDLVLKCFGDPTLSVADLDRLAATVRGRGIRSVTGRVLGDESFYDRKRGAAGWKSYFVGMEAPPLSALVVDRALGWPALSSLRRPCIPGCARPGSRSPAGRARRTGSAPSLASDVSTHSRRSCGA